MGVSEVSDFKFLYQYYKITYLVFLSLYLLWFNLLAFLQAISTSFSSISLLQSIIIFQFPLTLNNLRFLIAFPP